MQHNIAFLHTDKSHLPTFTSLMNQYAPELSVHHVVDAQLLVQARAEGLSASLAARIQNAMQNAASTGAQVVVCTCSTIGAIAEQSGVDECFHAMRIDRPMTYQALQTGRRLLVAATLKSTLGPTQDLIADTAMKMGLAKNAYQINLLDISHAWPHFEQGDKNLYFESIHSALFANWHNHDVIVLAQASMAGVHSVHGEIGVAVLSSPETGVVAAINAYKNISIK